MTPPWVTQNVPIDGFEPGSDPPGHDLVLSHRRRADEIPLCDVALLPRSFRQPQSLSVESFPRPNETDKAFIGAVIRGRQAHRGAGDFHSCAGVYALAIKS